MHSLAVRRLALEVADTLDGYPCDRDLLATAALLHDLDKIDEIELSLATGGEAKYTLGQLHGHIVHGVRRLEQAAMAIGLSAAIRDHLIHLIASHHGTNHWGSPVVPMTPEAVALHVADYAASRVEAVLDAADAKEPDGDWTGYSKMLEARVYLGFALPPGSGPQGW
jgi:3'-5' exoribonuclease